VFVATRLDDSWVRWSQPKNLGAEINTSGMDAYYSVPASGDVAFCSSSNASNHMDIYMVTLTEDIRPSPVMLVTGRVATKEGSPISATVTYRRLSTDSVTTVAITNPSTGLFAAILPTGEQYEVHASAVNYLPYAEDLDLRKAFTYQELRVTITLDTAAAGGAMTLQDLFFDLDRSELRPEAHFELDRVATELRHRKGWQIRIEGFTDSTGDETHNKDLSRRRAESVLEYLAANGVERSSMQAFGYGSADAVGDNSTPEGRRKNRRVVLRLAKQ
jgi:outer membrane protein OmpA-like peptidoglycan-associated protein